MLFSDPAHLPDGPLMAIDPGAKTLGVAVSNSSRTLVTPLTTIRRVKFILDAQILLTLYDERGCAGLVVGLPLHMNGAYGRRAQSSRSFITNLLRIRDLPVVCQDERLSTFTAIQSLAESGIRPSRRKDDVDAQAAAVILEAAIDRIHQNLQLTSLDDGTSR